MRFAKSCSATKYKAEVFGAVGGDKSDAWERYLVFGGMPQSVLEPDEHESMQILRSLFDFVYFRDLVERHKFRDDAVLRAVANTLASSVGSLVNPRRIEDTLRSAQGKSAPTAPTVKKYMDYLEDAFLFDKAQRYDVRGRRYLDTPCKYFAVDVGLRNACVNFREPEQTHLMENIVYTELRRRGFSVDVGVVDVQATEAGRRVFRQHEIDFVINDPAGKLYVQSAFNIDDPARRAAETISLKKTGDSFRKLVVTGGNRRLSTDEDGISYVGIIPFLLDGAILSSLL